MGEEYIDIQVPVVISHVEPQPFRLRDFRTGRRVGVLANSIRGVQDLALNDTTQISSDGYLMFLPENEVVVAVPRDQWDRMY